MKHSNLHSKTIPEGTWLSLSSTSIFKSSKKPRSLCRGKRKLGWNASAAFKWSHSKGINSGGKLNFTTWKHQNTFKLASKLRCISWNGSAEMKWTPTGSSTIALYGCLLMLCLCVCRYWALTTGTPLELNSISPHTNMFTSVASAPQWLAEIVRHYK